MSPEFEYTTFDSFTVTTLDDAEFVSLVRAGRGQLQSRAVVRTIATQAGSIGIKYGVLTPARTEAEAQFIETFHRKTVHTWDDRYVYFLHMPVILAIGTGCIFDADGIPFFETLFPSLGDQKFQRLTGLSAGAPGKRIVDHAWNTNSAYLGVGLSRWSPVYFHMITEAAVNLRFCQQFVDQRITCFPVPRVLKGAQGIIRDIGNGAVWYSDRALLAAEGALFSDQLYNHASLSASFGETIDWLRTRAGGASTLGERLIYVSRQRATARRLENEDACVELFQRFGFEIVFAEDLSFFDQVRLFSSARIVAGPHGAGLLNAAFMNKSGLVYELRPLNRPESSPMWNESYRRVAAAMDHKYVFDVFENEARSNSWRADLERVRQTLEANV